MQTPICVPAILYASELDAGQEGLDVDEVRRYPIGAAAASFATSKEIAFPMKMHAKAIIILFARDILRSKK